jgi:hypothetical protein
MVSLTRSPASELHELQPPDRRETSRAGVDLYFGQQAGESEVFDAGSLLRLPALPQPASNLGDIDVPSFR